MTANLVAGAMISLATAFFWFVLDELWEVAEQGLLVFWAMLGIAAMGTISYYPFLWWGVSGGVVVGRILSMTVLPLFVHLVKSITAE